MFRFVAAHSPATPITAISLGEPRARSFLKEASPSPLLVMCNHQSLYVIFFKFRWQQSHILCFSSSFLPVFFFFSLFFNLKNFNIVPKQSLFTRISVHTHSVLRRSCSTLKAMADAETITVTKTASSSASGSPLVL